MRGAFGKPQGTVARVDIGQIIMSVRVKDAHKEKVIEALRRAKFKYPGRQKVYKLLLDFVCIVTCASLWRICCACSQCKWKSINSTTEVWGFLILTRG